jgi:hypothetical protein
MATEKIEIKMSATDRPIVISDGTGALCVLMPVTK